MNLNLEANVNFANQDDLDELQGASHQIFHALVVLGQIVFLLGLRSVISTHSR